mgnify:CR=1 FL=1
MKRDIIRLICFVLLLAATVVGIIGNVLTFINFDSAVNTVWEKYQIITFLVVLSLLCLLAIYNIFKEIKQLIQDIKIKKE